VVLTVRMYGTRPLYGPRLVRKFSSHELQTCRSARRVSHEHAIVSQLRSTPSPSISGISMSIVNCDQANY
jgi:hypothetical protein